MFFPAIIAILLIFFLVMNFERVAMAAGYLSMVGLMILVISAIGYGLYDILGPQVSLFIGIVVIGILGMIRIGGTITGFVRGFVEGYRTGPAGKA